MAADQSNKGQKPATPDAARERRLAEALRANLRRRKAAHAPEDSAPPPAGRGQKPTSAE